MSKGCAGRFAGRVPAGRANAVSLGTGIVPALTFVEKPAVSAADATIAVANIHDGRRRE
jgi:hypothetical protein